MLKHREVNPLAVANARQLTFCPAHFLVMHIELKVSTKRISDWLYENTEGRFYMDHSQSLAFKIGFENHSEATYFSMKLNEINSNNFWDL